MNFKRVFCSVLTAAMLLSVSVTGASAAPVFADAAEITYAQAVAAAAEKGLFAGSEVDGKIYFNPKDTVTRAQMATVMVKLLKGSDFDADPYKGAANTFVDTADFQGGWAEGYISACAQLGVVSGKGENKYVPADKVTAAEAVTMVIKALKVETEAGNWVNWYDSFMSKAEELELFGVIEPKPAANDPMSREQLAVIVLEGVKYLEQGETESDTGSGSTGSGSSGSGSTGSGSSGSGSTGSGSSGSGSTGSGSSGSGSSGSDNTGSADSDSADSNSTDSGSTDTGSTDSGSTDTGSTDSGSTDTGSADSGSTETDPDGFSGDISKLPVPENCLPLG